MTNKEDCIYLYMSHDNHKLQTYYEVFQVIFLLWSLTVQTAHTHMHTQTCTHAHALLCSPSMAFFVLAESAFPQSSECHSNGWKITGQQVSILERKQILI